MTLYAHFYVAELPEARTYPHEIDFSTDDKAPFTSLTPIHLARLCSLIMHAPNELLGLGDFLKLSEDDNGPGVVLTPVPP